MPNTQNEQVKTDTSFEENYIDENVSVKTNKTKEFIKKFMKRKTAVAAFFVMCFLLLMALFGPSLAPYAPEAYDYDNILAGPSASHLFGTDQYGRDIFSRILADTPLLSAYPCPPLSWALPWVRSWDFWPATTAAGSRCW